ncbi:hypothetical protein ACYZT2_09545 [Pseudomonas sp. MDT1-85]
MTTSTPPDNTVLVLSPPIVNGQTTPVEGAHIGVPLVAYDLVTDGEGAVVLVDPPLSGAMDPGDVMELWLEDESAALDSETIVDPHVRTTLRIPKGRLHPDKVNKLYYTVRRGSSNIGTSTPSLEVLYNRIRPGLKDRLTDPGGHSELKLLLPDVIKNGVGPDFVSAEVCVAFPYCRAYDLITLKCNGELLEPKPRVNPNQAPQPPSPGSEDPITICFTITRAYLDKAKRQDKKLHFSYTVTDQIGNGPDTDAPWSPVQTVDEDLDGVLLPMPILLERKEDYPGDDASIIDLEKLAGGPLLLVVITQDNRFEVGDEILATYITTGQTEPVVVSGKVEGDPFIGKLPCFLEVPNEKVFAGSKVTATYELRRPNGEPVGSSNTANATVTDAAPIDLQPEITSVTDSLNKEIPHNGGTIDPQVRLTGTATPLQQVEIFEGAVTKGDRAVNARGIWTYDTTLNGIGTRTFTAKAKYGTGQVSADRTFTLSDALTPAITSVEDSGGVEIPNNGVTTDTSIKLSGTATPRLEVEIFDGAVSKGQATAHATTGVWTLLVTALAVAAHSFTAKALYGSGAVSAARTLTVTAATAPTLTSVKGSPSGVEIPQGGVTVETAVTLSGVAANGQKVEVFDGAVSKGQATAHATTGVWTLLVTALAVAAHSFTAKALYGSGAASAARTLTVTAVIAPTLSEVLDDKNVEIPEGQTTVSTALKLKGTASRGQKVEIFEGTGPSAVSKGVATASATGDWELSVSVAVGPRRFAAQSLYHPSPVYSNVRTLTVTAATAPTLTSVKGSPSGIEIPQGGVTVETAVTLSGVAANGQKVEVFDGAVSKGQATAHATTGVWTLLVTALAVAAHSFTAKALYGSGAVSAARTLTVTAATAPTLTSVKGSPSGVEIPQGGVTVETAVTLSGVAANGQKVEVFDGAVSKGQATAHATTGVWTLLVSALAVAAHSFTAKALYGNGAASAARTLTVTAVLKPTLSNVLDDKGAEVLEGQTTVSTALTLKGTASLGQSVEIFEGNGPSHTSKGVATASTATGKWELSITVAVGARRLYAQSLYHPSPEWSNVRTLTVTAAAAPTLSNVLDDKNVEVPEGQTTVSTTLKLKGTASKGQEVEIFEGTGPSAVSKGRATASVTTGEWELSVSVAVGPRRFAAQSLYHPSPVYSNVRTLTVTAATAPTLTSVKGSPSGVEIPQGGVTVETAVTLSGVAANGQKVEVFDGAVSKGQATAHATTGVWTLLVTALAVAAHSFTAKALYGSGAVSAARTLTVTAATAPTLTSVKGSPSGVEIPQGGVTVETAVTLSGVAANGQKVEVFDGAVSKGQATAHATTGVWTLLISALTVAAHSFTAKALYGSNPVSAARTFTVAVATAPTIASVKGTLSGREIPQGGTTAETAVTLRGIAANGLKVEVFDHGVSQGEATADGASGEWTFNVGYLGRVEHSFKVKALYGTRPESAPWNFTVLKAIHIPQGRLLIGRSISTETCRITFLTQNQGNCYIESKGNIFPYAPYSPSSITYQADLIGQTTDRVNLRAYPGNLTGPTTITIAYLNSSGATLKTTSTPVKPAETHHIDSGRLPGIASVRITVTGQVNVDQFEFGKVP